MDIYSAVEFVVISLVNETDVHPIAYAYSRVGNLEIG